MQYLIESSICLALLYALYHLILRKESFFQINRAYLLLAPLVAFALPALNIQLLPREETITAPVAPVTEEITTADWPTMVEQMQAAPRLIGETLEKPVWNLSAGTVLWWIYLIVGGLMLLRLLVQTWRLGSFIHSCKKETGEGFVLAKSPADGPIASFFGFVFWSPGALDDTDQQLIFEHEMVHVRQWHSLDLIFIELLIALQWFNPLLYIYRRSLREVHEYIADDYVVRRTRQRYQYAALLVRHNNTGNGAQPGLVNTFHSLIQKRLIMLAKRPSSPLQRAKYLLALPLFATLMLLFSFRLADKLPQVQKAADLLEKYTSTLSEATVLGEKPVERYEKKPYTFYWGPFEIRLVYVESRNHYAGGISLSAEEVWEAINQREPRLWTGETLQPGVAFNLNGIAVRSEYNRPTVYQAALPLLQNATKGLRQGDEVLIDKIELPDGMLGQISISITQSSAPPAPESEKSADISGIYWGTSAFLWCENRYMTVTELSKMLNTAPTVRFTNNQSKEPKELSFSLANEKGMAIRAQAYQNGSLTPYQLRQRLTEEKALVKPGATITFGAWDLQDPAAVSFDTIITFDPVTYEQTVQIVSREGVVKADLAMRLFSVTLVDDLDPRRSLSSLDLKSYAFQWGIFVQDIPRSMYARSFTTAGSTNRQHSDSPINMWSGRFTKKQLLQIFAEKAKLFQGEKQLSDFNFTLNYKGKGQLIENGNIPADLLKKLEQELKPGETISITGIQARENPFRHIVQLAGAGGNNPELKVFLERAYVRPAYDDQHLVHLLLPEKEFNTVYESLKTEKNIWFQYGDIDLSPVTFELEVKDEDPKPELPVTKTKGGIFTVKMSVSPNPVKTNEATSVLVRVEKPGEGILSLHNLEGKQLFSQKMAVEAGENKLELPATTLSAAGAYVVRFEMSYGIGSTKLVVE